LDFVFINLVLSTVDLEGDRNLLLAHISEGGANGDGLLVGLVGIHEDLRLNGVPVDVFISHDGVVGQGVGRFGVVAGALGPIEHHRLQVAVMHL